jgi:hypothetical protein
MTELLGPDYQIIENNGEPIALLKTPNDHLEELIEIANERSHEPLPESHETEKKTMDDYAFQFYVGSLTVVGLFMLFRMIQKSR